MTDYLAHYGRKGMKWGKHIFGDKSVTTVDDEYQKELEYNSKSNKYPNAMRPATKSVRDDDLEGRRRRMAANQAAAKSITAKKRARESEARKSNFYGKAASQYGYRPLVDASVKSVSEKSQRKVSDRNAYQSATDKGFVALSKLWTKSLDDLMRSNMGEKREQGRRLIRMMGIQKSYNVASDSYQPRK